MSWKPPFPLVKLPDCQQNWDSVGKEVGELRNGIILDSQIVIADGAGSTAVPGTSDQALGGLSISYTPPVDVYWEVTGNVGLVARTVAAWATFHPSIYLSPDDDDGVSTKRISLASHNAFPYVGGSVSFMFKLVAGTEYTATVGAYFPDLSFTYYDFAEYLWLQTRAWAR